MKRLMQAKYKVIGLRSYPLKRLNGQLVSVHSGLPPDVYIMDASFNEARRKGHLVKVWTPGENMQPLHVEEDMQRLHVEGLVLTEPEPEPESLPSVESDEVFEADEAEDVHDESGEGTPISDLGLPPEIEEALLAGGISTVEALMEYPDKPESLTSFKGIGKSRAQAIMMALVSW